MKKLTIIIAFASLIMVSCDEDFIDLFPISSVTVDKLYKTDKDFKDAFPPIYDNLQSIYNQYWMFGDLRGDDSWDEIVKSGSDSYMDLFTTKSDDGLMNTTWTQHYIAIFRVNTLLTKIEDKDVSEVPNKESYIAEARFIRGLMYFNLVRIFGDVPMITIPLSIDEGYKTPREPVDNIYNQIIIPDLLAAESVLPVKWGSSDVGRPTRGAAKGILSRVYLILKDFQKAETKLQELTTMGYELLPSFTRLFDHTQDEHHSEYIWDIEYEEGLSEANSFTTTSTPNSLLFTTHFGMKMTEGGECNSPTQLLVDLFVDQDLRKETTIGEPGGFTNTAGEFILLPPNTSQTYTKKWIVPFAMNNDAKANWKLIRYGDVLLMYAEALNENGKTAQAIPYLNQIRTRAGMPEYPLTLTQSETRDAIVLERRLELSFEGVRWFDLVRTGKAYDVMKDYGMQSYMWIFPIPLSQIELMNNTDIFPQNPGYN